MSDTHRKGLHASAEELSEAALPCSACTQFIRGGPGPDGTLLIVFVASLLAPLEHMLYLTTLFAAPFLLKVPPTVWVVTFSAGM